MPSSPDPGLLTLLDLHGSILDQGEGYWIKIEAWTIEVSAAIPHGIPYSLTLHEPYGGRILGYDNAHGVKPPKKFKFAGRRLACDHRHRHASDHGVPYGFVDAHQSLQGFFAEADDALARHRNR